MPHDDMEDDEEEFEERAPRRSSGPRFGPFLTIAVAILLLFGAVSRMGKTSDAGSLFDFDFLASRSLEREQLRRQERRNTTLITLGAIPTVAETNVPPQGLHLREDALPPERDVDFYAYQEQRRRELSGMTQLSLTMPTEGNNHHPGASESAPRFDPAPEARPHAPEPAAMGSYVVAQGDNWVKIGKKAGKKWEAIRQANPQAHDGLRVGMRLTIP